MNQCYTSSFTCIDCSRQFDSSTVHGHTQCVTEHDKYAKGATKPGGFAEKGFYDDQGKTDPGGTGRGGVVVVGQEFLSLRAPWVCSVCNVTCTSKQTLESHATGTKHIRRVRARLREQGGEMKEENVEEKTDTQAAAEGDGDRTKKKKDKKDMKQKKKKDSNSDKKKNLQKLARKELEKNNGSMKKKKLFKALEVFLQENKYDEKRAEKHLAKTCNVFTLEGKHIKLSS